MTSEENYILAGDIGGTKSILVIAESDKTDRGFLHFRKFESGNYGSLEEILRDFFLEIDIEEGKTTACFGIAGPVKDNRVTTTNLPWNIDGDAIKKSLGFRKLELMNDFKANIRGIPYLKAQDQEILNKGRKDDDGPIAIIGAGTGLGEGLALYVEASQGYIIIASEGGHCDFSPKNDEEIGLLRYLLDRYDHVSFERVLSGQGLVNIYDYLAAVVYAEQSPETLEAISSGDQAAVISSRGLEGKDEICVKALDMFTSIYGTEAGNLALKILPTGGLYIAGGMAPKIIKKLRNDTFMRAFLNKGRLSGFLKNIPVTIILNTDIGLYGALDRGREIAAS